MTIISLNSAKQLMLEWICIVLSCSGNRTFKYYVDERRFSEVGNYSYQAKLIVCCTLSFCTEPKLMVDWFVTRLSWIRLSVQRSALINDAFCGFRPFHQKTIMMEPCKDLRSLPFTFYLIPHSLELISRYITDGVENLCNWCQNFVQVCDSYSFKFK
jgi:hypothetical protein